MGVNSNQKKITYMVKSVFPSVFPYHLALTIIKGIGENEFDN